MKVCLECYGSIPDDGPHQHMPGCTKFSNLGPGCLECRYPMEKFVAQQHFDTCSLHPANLNPGFRRGYLSQPRRAGRSQAIPPYIGTTASPTGRISAGPYVWRASMPAPKIYMTYTKLEDIPVLIAIHHQATDAIMKAAEDEDYRIGELPPNMDFAEAVKAWEEAWGRDSAEKERRERLKNWLTEEGYDPAKIDELVVHSDDDPNNS